MTGAHPLGNTALRTSKSYAKYSDKPAHVKGHCVMCEGKEVEQIGRFRHWKIIKNDYPYDRVATLHTMLVPRRHVANFDGIDFAEAEELWQEVRPYINTETTYDSFLENTTRGRSILSHFHYHLVRWKRG